MTDCFAVVGLPRRPHLEEAALKDVYFQRAALLHPDAATGGTEEFRELQEAFGTLSDPGRRLRHLQELAFPDFQNAPSVGAHGELFLTISQAVHTVQDVLKRLEKSQSALVRALLTGEIAAAAVRIRAAVREVNSVHEQLRTELIALDHRWPGVEAEEVSSLASRFTFLARWQSELAEWEFRIKQAGA